LQFEWWIAIPAFSFPMHHWSVRDFAILSPGVDFAVGIPRKEKSTPGDVSLELNKPSPEKPTKASRRHNKVLGFRFYVLGRNQRGQISVPVIS
jgi:hypothetical protein